jgi:hypothetical protein
MRSLVLTLPLLLAAAASAQEPDWRTEAEALRRRLDDQQAELEELRRRLDAAFETAPVDTRVATPPEGHPPLAVAFDGELVELTAKLGRYTLTLHPRAGVQTDLRAYPAGDARPDDKFLVRRARVGLDGTLGDFAFVIQVQVQRAPTQLIDAWVQWQRYDELRLRFGHFKTPFSLDNGPTGGDFTTDFIERPMVIGSGRALAPDFRLGAESLGTLAGGHLRYWLSVQNEPDSSEVRSSDLMYCARVEALLGSFSLGGGGIWEWHPDGEPSFAGLTPGQFEFFTPVTVAGLWQRYEVDATCYTGPVFARVELAYAEQERRGVLAGGRDGTPLCTQGGQLTLGWMVGGKRAGAKPSTLATQPDSGRAIEPLDDWSWLSWSVLKRRDRRQAGLEVLTRVEWMRLDDRRGGGTLANGQSVPAATGAAAINVRGAECTALSFGVNVNPIETVRFSVNYAHLWFSDRLRAERAADDAQSDELLLRAQLDF